MPTSSAEAEAADVVGAILTALRDGWTVARRAPDGTESWEPCRLGDICILLPARTSLGQLEDALEAAGIPARAETSSLVYGTPRDPRPARRAARGRRPHRRARARHRAALPGVRVRRRRPLHVRGRPSRPLEPSGAAPGVAARRPSGRPVAAGARRVARRPAVAGPERAARPHRARTARAGGRVRPRAARATSGGACGSSSTRPARSRRPRAAACATSSTGPTCRAPRAHASSRPCSPRPTTTPCASSPSTARRAWSSRSPSCRA